MFSRQLGRGMASDFFLFSEVHENLRHIVNLFHSMRRFAGKIK